MLAPLRDHLRPKDPKSSPLLCMAKERYFTRMSVDIYPDKPEYGESRWIVSEDVNVEHLLDVFTTIDASSESIWDTCANFMDHLYWHKGRLVILGLKIEGLADNHRSKPKCLSRLSRLFHSVGNYAEDKRLLTSALELYRERRNDRAVAQTLRYLSNTNQFFGLYKEGIRQAEEALEIFEQLGDTVEQAKCLVHLADLLYLDRRIDTAEETASRAINLLSETGEQYWVCKSHRVLGKIYYFQSETEKAIHHLELALGIASPFDWDDQLFWVHTTLANLFCDEGRFDDAQNHLERAKTHTVVSTYYLGHTMMVQAELWYEQGRLGEAKSEALCAAGVYKKLGAAEGLEGCRNLLRRIERGIPRRLTGSSDDDGELFVQGDANYRAHQVPLPERATESER